MQRTELIDWIEWKGGECPVPGEMLVEVELRNGRKAIGLVGNITWAHYGSPWDIVAYRLSGGKQVNSAPISTGGPLTKQVGGGHYKDMAIQPVEFIHANTIGYFEGNVIKYVSRWRKKNGIADLEKARHYIDLLIELETKNARKTD